MKDRIISFLKSRNITATEFADAIGVQRSNVSHVLSGRNNPSFTFIHKMLEAFPSIDSRWLITGEYTSNNEQAKSDSDVTKREAPNDNTADNLDFRESYNEQSNYSSGEPISNLFSQPNTILESIDRRSKESTNIGSVVDDIKEYKPKVESRSTLETNSNKILESEPKKMTRIVVFFSDNTFQEYKPS